MKFIADIQLIDIVAIFFLIFVATICLIICIGLITMIYQTIRYGKHGERK